MVFTVFRKSVGHLNYDKYYIIEKWITVICSWGKIPFGSEHMWQMMTRKISAIGCFIELIKKFPDDKLFGVYNFGQRSIVVNDMELAKRILIKDADHFIDRPAVDTEGATKEGDKIFALFLTNLKGEQWKKVTYAYILK